MDGTGKIMMKLSRKLTNLKTAQSAGFLLLLLYEIIITLIGLENQFKKLLLLVWLVENNILKNETL